MNSRADLVKTIGQEAIAALKDGSGSVWQSEVEATLAHWQRLEVSYQGNDAAAAQEAGKVIATLSGLISGEQR